ERSAGQGNDEADDRRHGGRHAGDDWRVSERKYQQWIGQGACVGTGVGEELADPEHAEAAVATERDRLLLRRIRQHAWLRRAAHLAAAGFSLSAGAAAALDEPAGSSIG